MIDCGFPIITYEKGKTPRQKGLMHGESHREAITELALIRRDLMLAKNPRLQKQLSPLGMEQWYVTKRFAPHLCDEIEAIAEASNLSILDLVILNNYTDFRDIELPEEGCSTIHTQVNGVSLSGQTWDMHRSAKNYMCVIHDKGCEVTGDRLFLTLVGCSALMGLNTLGCFAGVNNINTQNAKAGLIWPVLIRRLLEKKSLESMRNLLIESPVTSGHNYLISDKSAGEHWEVTPHISEQVSKLAPGQQGSIFHTNHCLGPKTKELEDQKSISSTTHIRFDLLGKKKHQVVDFNSMVDLLQDHEGEPKSLCSHFESGAQDPSFTCGGGVYDLTHGEVKLWRGCPTYDKNYKAFKYKRDGLQFIKVSQ